MIPQNRTEARAVALAYVRGMLARGYDSQTADREIMSGYCAPGEPGWVISHGTITVPHTGPLEYRFRFAELEAEAIGPQQLALF